MKSNLEEAKEKNIQRSKNERNNLRLKLKEINHNLTEKQIKAKNEQQIKNSIDKFWQKSEALLNNSEDSPIIQTTPAELSTKSNNKKTKARKYAEKVRYKNMEINDNNTELPKIPLFNQNEKKILLGVLPEKELNKYEKRYEYIEKEKNNLFRRFALENKQLQKDNEIYAKKFEYNSNQLNEGEKKNSILKSQLVEQQKEIVRLTDKLAQMKENLIKKKLEVKQKDEENKKLVAKIQKLQKFSQENNNGDEEEGEEGEAEGEEGEGEEGEAEGEAEGEEGEAEADGEEGEAEGEEGVEQNSYDKDDDESSNY